MEMGLANITCMEKIGYTPEGKSFIKNITIYKATIEDLDLSL